MIKSFLVDLKVDVLVMVGLVSDLEVHVTVRVVNCEVVSWNCSTVRSSEIVCETIWIEEFFAEEANRWCIDVTIDSELKVEFTGISVKGHFGWCSLGNLHIRSRQSLDLEGL